MAYGITMQNGTDYVTPANEGDYVLAFDPKQRRPDAVRIRRDANGILPKLEGVRRGCMRPANNSSCKVKSAEQTQYWAASLDSSVFDSGSTSTQWEPSHGKM